MKITNNLNLPEPLYEAIKNDPYDAGDSDISVTRLISPPRQVALLKGNYDRIEEDAADRIYAAMGQGFHTLMERAALTGLIEERLFSEVKGWNISGQIDWLDTETHTLWDFKVMSIWEIMNGLNEEKTEQLNCLAWLCRQNGHKVESLKILGVFRDWSKAKAGRERDYPQHQARAIPIEMWQESDQRDFIYERVGDHMDAQKGRLPKCTDEERWKDPAKFAVMKEGRKSALRVLDSERGAARWVDANNHGTLYEEVEDGRWEDHVGLNKGISIQHRPSEARRCASYCAAAPFCTQYQEELKNGN